MTEANTIFFSGEILTMNEAEALVEAVAVADGRILGCGRKADVEAFAGSKTVFVDLKGRTLMPGFVEPHTHPALVALLQGAPVIDIRAMSVPTWDAALLKIKRKVAKSEPGEFIYFLGLDPQLHQGLKVPDLEELNALSPDNPLAIQTSNLHTIYCNSQAMAAAELTDDSKAPVGGEFGRDVDGRLSGVFVESKAVAIITGAAMKGWGMDRAFRAFEAAIWQNVRAGVTTLAELIFEPAYNMFYPGLAERADCPVRVRAYEQYNLSREPSVGLENGTDDFKILGIKIHADGSPFVGNIGTSKPYLNNNITLKHMHLAPDHLGATNLNKDQLQLIIDRYADQGWQIAIHTQGDRSIDMALKCYEHTIKRLSLLDHRFRLEHCALMTREQIKKALELGVVCSFFPNHIYFWGEAIRDNLFGPEVAARYMPMGDAADAGMRFSLHGDAPMTDTDPLGFVQLAATRRTKLGAVLGQEQCISVERALRAVTVDAAYQLFLDQDIGTIEPGKSADFVVLEKNPLSVAPEDVSRIAVVETWFRGRRVVVPTEYRS
jgi:predicted amidohydrolase YtcJ